MKRGWSMKACEERGEKPYGKTKTHVHNSTANMGHPGYDSHRGARSKTRTAN